MQPIIKTHFQIPTPYCFLFLISIVSLGIGLRLFDLTDQPIDFHSTRQLRGAIIARGMYYEMSPLFDNEIRDMAIKFWDSTGQYEPSILERIVAITYFITGKENFWIARIYNSIFWAIGGLALFGLARRIAFSSLNKNTSDRKSAIAFLSALLVLTYYLVLPFSVQASRSFQPDPSMVMWITLSAYSTYRWSEVQDWKWALLSGIFSGMAVLTKAVSAYTIAGILTSLTLYTFGFPRTRPFFRSFRRVISSPQVWSIALLAILPTAIYYLTRGERASEYFTSWTLSLSHLLLEPWLYARWVNLVRRLMSVIPLIAAGAGTLIARKRNRALLIGLWSGYILYGLFLPYQMYTHNYYHLQLVAIIAISMTPAVALLVERFSRMRIIFQYLGIGMVLIGIIISSWIALQPLYGQDYRNEPAYWQTIASYLPSDGKIIALTQDYGYRLMYYGWRKVALWPNQGEQNLSKLRNSEKDPYGYFNKKIQDKSYFLITSFNQFDKQPILQSILYDNFPIIAEGSGYIIFDVAQ